MIAQQELTIIFLPTENLKVHHRSSDRMPWLWIATGKSHTHTALFSQNPPCMPTCIYTQPSSRRPCDPVECLSQSLPSRLLGLLCALLQDTFHDPFRVSDIPAASSCKLCCWYFSCPSWVHGHQDLQPRLNNYQTNKCGRILQLFSTI